jgi:hypothetical protein
MAIIIITIIVSLILIKIEAWDVLQVTIHLLI